MKTFKYSVVLLAGFFIFAACQKEFSKETKTFNGIATGSLKNPAGDCREIIVAGQYIKGNTLSDSSFITVQVNFTSTGSYTIFTGTENGFSFRYSGNILSAGLQNIELKAVGKPQATQLTSFTVYSDTSICTFTVNVTDTAVVRKDAVFTLAATGSACANANIQGTYRAGGELNTSNLVSIDVNVTSAGGYNLVAGPLNGITFSAKGTFTSTGLQTVTLKGSGTPVIAEIASIPVSAGSTSCKFEVVVEEGTGETGGGTAGDNPWSFNHGSAYTQGSIDLAILSSNPLGGSGSILAITGLNSNSDTALSFFILLPGSTITAGTYKTNQGNTTLFSLNKTTGDPVYTSNNTTPNAVMSIVIVSYDAASKVVTGTFSGNAIKEQGGSLVAITNGKFHASVE